MNPTPEPRVETHPTLFRHPGTPQTHRGVAVRDRWTRDFRVGPFVVHPAAITTVVAISPRGTAHDDPTGIAAVLAELTASRVGTGVTWVEPTLVLVDLPVDAVRLALDCQAWVADRAPEIPLGIGVHLGEASFDEFSGSDARPRPIVGPAFEIASALRDLARPGQILVTRGTFDLTRQGSLRSKAEDVPVETSESARAPRQPVPQWMAHGAYHLAGFQHPLRIYEVGAPGTSPLEPPPDSGTAVRIRGDGTLVGWRPALDHRIPGRPNWRLTRHLGTGGHGEAWLARQTKTGEARVFEFCHRQDGLSALRREVVIFRLLKDRLGNRDDSTRLLDWQFDKAPFYLEFEYSRPDKLPDPAPTGGPETTAWQRLVETRLELASVLLEVGQTEEAASQVEQAVEAVAGMPPDDPLRRRVEAVRRKVATGRGH